MAQTSRPRRRANRRAGFVFPTALLFLLIISLLVGSLAGYVDFGTRLTAESITATQCRLAAQTALEDAKLAIYEGFIAHANRYPNLSPQTLLSDIGSNANYWVETRQVLSPNTGCTLGYNIGFDSTNYLVTRRVTLTLQVTATKRSPLGKSVSRTLQERFSMAVEQSKVFDYAYFVNSFGILQSGSINGNAYFNGDAVISRNLADVWTQSDCIINGTVTAAANDITGAFGLFRLPDATDVTWPHAESLSQYRDRQKDDPLCRPTSPADDAKTEIWPMGFTAADNSTELQRNEGAAIFELPYLSNLGLYKDLAKTTGGTVTYSELVLNDSDIQGLTDASYFDDKIGKWGDWVKKTYYKQGATKTIKGVFTKETGVGPSGVAKGVDAGCVMMYGTKEKPIKIDGPVVVEGDLVIGGYVEGRGCFYAGRNIHFVDDITYVNRPDWSNSMNDPYASKDANATSDLVGFCAKGLITIGPVNNAEGGFSSWCAGPSMLQWNLAGQGLYETDPNTGKPKLSYNVEASAPGEEIGYPEGLFNGNYYQNDGFQRIEKITIETAEDGSKKQVISTAARQFYEPTVEAKYVKFANLQMDHIDGVLFTNHAILGGRDNYSGAVKPFTINGAYVTRNQAMNFQPLSFNWDIRLGSESKENLENPIYLPMTIDRPRLLSWHEVQTRTDD
ncbi:MAG: hypothetical protein ACI4YA_03805 [Candidatus Spyradenecus sp.]